MTLLELSVTYADHAALLRGRIIELRGLQHQTPDPEMRRCLQQRISALLPLWQEARDLAQLTAHYYDESGVIYEAYQL